MADKPISRTDLSTLPKHHARTPISTRQSPQSKHTSGSHRLRLCLPRRALIPRASTIPSTIPSTFIPLWPVLVRQWPRRRRIWSFQWIEEIWRGNLTEEEPGQKWEEEAYQDAVEDGRVEAFVDGCIRREVSARARW